MAAEKRKLHKVTFTTDLESQRVNVGFSPRKGREVTHEDTHIYLNTILSGAHVGMLSILSTLPILRPATPEEKELNAYIFKDEKRDNALFKSRKQIYDGIANTFNTILNEAFPDVVYVENTRKYQQEFVFGKSDEEIDEYQKSIEELANMIRTKEEEKEKEV